MKKLLISAALVGVATVPSAANAQAVPGAVIAVVDLERVTAQCNACKTASAALRGQVTALQTRQQTLAGPLQTEGKSIQDAVNALNGKEPDAALKTRAQGWETRRQQAAQEVSRQEQQIQANGQYVQRQINDRLGPIYSQVMQRRGANVLLEQGSTLASASAVDVTNDVLTALNAALTTLQTTAPAAAPAARQPQGR